MTYRFLPHTADVRVAIDAPSFQHLLTDATEIMRQLLVGDSIVMATEERVILITAADPGEILHGFLRELLYVHATEGFLPAAAQVDTLAHNYLEARVVGEHFDPARHAQEPEVKAVTRHGFLVEKTDDGWHVEVVFDV